MTHRFHNPETIQAATAFGAVPIEGTAPAPWLLALDDIKSREKEAIDAVTVHQASSSRYAEDLAIQLGMSPAEAAKVGAAMAFHDVGKIHTPSDILGGEKKLTDEQFVKMRAHARQGYDMLGEIDGIPQVFLDVALYHHERYDGRGYERMAGEDVPYAARIAQVCDVFDAITEKRPYRENLVLPADALVDMVSDAANGRVAFDPIVLRTFVARRLALGVAGDAPEVRRKLVDFVRSDPNLELTETANVRFEADGSRSILDPADRERVVSRFGRDGSATPVEPTVGNSLTVD